jgi:uncharacterized membrane-anchored protein
MATKVPEVTALFWIIKLLTTAGGESSADLLAMEWLGMKTALALTGGALAVVLVVQLATRRYVVPVYWSVIVLVGVAGTLITDAIVQVLKVSELMATLGFGVALLVMFAVWYRIEGTLSIHSINTTRRELFYWAAVLTTFALGTAAGDLTAFALHWGFPLSIALYATIFATAGVAHLLFGLDAIACFWLAYVMTRPLGATVADYLAFGHDLGALGFGLLPVSMVFAVAIVTLVGYLTITRVDTPKETPAQTSAAA